MTSIDAYRRLLEEEGAEEVERRLAAINDRYRFGSAASTAPPIFETELKEARERGARGRGETPAADLLILLTGSSPEPLLLAVAYHAPAEVVFLTGKGARGWNQALGELWDHYRELLEAVPFARVQKIPVGTSPAELFKTVRGVVERRRLAGQPKIVLDITGAKKSMIAGAFLAAGFLGLETSYVDFDHYDPILRRPVPGSSRPIRLEHPDQLFRLRDERRLEAAFDDRRWEEAERLAGELRDMAESEPVAEVLDRGEAAALATRYGLLGRVAAGCRAWSDGFFADAWEALAREDSFSLPPTVELLGSVWPRRQDEHPTIRAALAPVKVFADPAVALAYFLDVLVWTDDRQLAQRPRETFLRLYGAVESVFLWLFAAFGGTRGEHLELGCPSEEDFASFDAEVRAATGGEGLKASKARRFVASKCLDESSRRARELLCGELFLPRPGERPTLLPRRLKENPDWEEPRRLRAWLAEPPRGEAIPLALACKGCDTHEPFEEIARLRNKATHWLAPVPPRLARQLHDYYRWVLQSLVPPAVQRWKAHGAAPLPLDTWERRLLEAAAGNIPTDCLPPTCGAVLTRVSPGPIQGSGSGTAGVPIPEPSPASLQEPMTDDTP